MKVILTSNVPKLGVVGDVCEVAPGYGRNFLLPQRLALPASGGSMKQIEDLKRTEKRRQDRVRAETESLAKRIEALELSFTAKVGETGRLYGSITASDIAEAIEAQIGAPVDRRKIVLDETLRTLGDHEVPLHLMPGVTATVHVHVEADAELVKDIPVEVDEPSGDDADEDYDDDDDDDDYRGHRDDYDDYDD